MLRITEFMPNTKFLVDHSQVVCHDNAMTQDVCSNILFLVAGYNSEQLNKVNLREGEGKTLVAHFCVFSANVCGFDLHLPHAAQLPDG